MEKEKQKNEDKDEEEDKNENNAQALVLFEEKKGEDKEVKDINDYNDEKYNDCNYWHVELSDNVKEDILSELD